MTALVIVLEMLLAFLIGTIFFDVVHYFMHRAMRATNPLFKAIGHWHSIHHRFFPSDLQIKTEWMHKNLYQHVLPEYLIELLGTALCFFIFHPVAVLLAILSESFLFMGVWLAKGVDLHHRSYKNLPAYRGGIWVSADYHALHHIYPSSFYSGYVKLFDYIFGTASHLSGKNITMTGASGALGSHMKQLLEKEGAQVATCKFKQDYDYQSYEKLIPLLQKTDILFLCHGSKYEEAMSANCESFIEIIELYRKVKEKTLLPPEIWAVGSEIECHPCFGIKKLWPYAVSKRAYAKVARQYYHDPSIQYRHLVHAAFTSQMGPGLMTASFAAKVTLFYLKRGFKYVPVTYTGFAYLNYLRFVFAKFTPSSLLRSQETSERES